MQTAESRAPDFSLNANDSPSLGPAISHWASSRSGAIAGSLVAQNNIGWLAGSGRESLTSGLFFLFFPEQREGLAIFCASAGTSVHVKVTRSRIRFCLLFVLGV